MQAPLKTRQTVKPFSPNAQLHTPFAWLLFRILCVILNTQGAKTNRMETHDGMINCIKDERGYTADAAAVQEAAREKQRLLQKAESVTTA